DEAKLLNSLVASPVRQISRSNLDRSKNLFESMIIEVLQVPGDLTFQGNGRIYLEHLKQLGLIDFSFTSSPEALMDGGVQVGVRNFGEHLLSEWGRQFMRSVTPPGRSSP